MSEILLASAELPAHQPTTTSGVEERVYGGTYDPSFDSLLTTLSATDRQTLQMQCQNDLQGFIQDNAELTRKHSAQELVPNPDDMLFFLHVPRTAGRTFFSCFLKQAIPPSKRCAKSYDVLRLNVSIADCGLLSSHDDYSVSKFLPETSAIITQVRNPVDRVLSAYEFAVEVAARELRRPPAGKRPQPDPSKVNTRNVWPWSLLVPWMEADMRTRIAKMNEWARKPAAEHSKNWVKLKNQTTGAEYYHNYRLKVSKWELDPENDNLVQALDPYNNHLIMPLQEFINHPLVRDTVHNGATLQVLGLTNYSNYALASKLRSCIDGLPNAKEAMTKAALARLRTMFHVGTTDQLEESIASAAAALEVKLGGPSWKGKADAAFSYEEDKDDTKVVELEPPSGAAAAARQEAPQDQAVAAEEGGVELEAGQNAESQKRIWQNRIDDLNFKLEHHAVDLRKAKLGLRTAQHKTQTVPASRDGVGPVDDVQQHEERVKELEKEIDEMKAEVANLQVLLVRLKTLPPKIAQHSARLVADDNTFKNEFNLTSAYHRCVVSSRNKQAGRWKSMMNVRYPDGRWTYFSYETRKQLSPTIINRIKVLNSMDVRLYETAQTLLQEARERQSASGVLEGLTKPPKIYQAGGDPPLPAPPGEGGAAEAAGAGQKAGPEPGGSRAAGQPNAQQAKPDARGGQHRVPQKGGPQQPAPGVNPGVRRPQARPNAQAAGLNRAPEGPGSAGPRRRRPNPDAVIDYNTHEEL
eukprot:CAMPEP_0117657586 /NCGR_PEP_ID=MMETSP0804-20121206/5411_1 /TAXON_ID=1074897 /ORGANISM="Tetraselmis astigmatica, Strain CCMP880" /LENGTH=750 /DNA_ID=CAMNT_0005464053 /DNA_START=271 /DNA_END=2519 /DNA_ORIENTATION=-